MDVIVNSAHHLGNAIHLAHDAAKIGMESWSPFCLDDGSSFFCREDNVVMQ